MIMKKCFTGLSLFVVLTMVFPISAFAYDFSATSNGGSTTLNYYQIHFTEDPYYEAYFEVYSEGLDGYGGIRSLVRNDISNVSPINISLSNDKDHTVKMYWKKRGSTVTEEKYVVEYFFPLTSPNTFETYPNPLYVPPADDTSSDTTINPSDSPTLDSQLVYQSFRDEYRLDWQKPPSSTKSFIVKFTSDNGTVYEKKFDYVEGKDTLYLSCNGNYDIRFLDSKGNPVSKIEGIKTSNIVNPKCDSYPERDRDDLNIKKTENPDNTVTLNWDTPIGTDHFKLYKDGQSIGTTVSPTLTTGEDGAYTVQAVDSMGNVLGESDIFLHNVNCDLCKCISELENVMEQVDFKTGQMLTKMGSQLKKMDDIRFLNEQMTLALDDVVQETKIMNGSITAFHGEFKTDKEYSVPNKDNYNVTLEENKPLMHEIPFEDKTIYFTDQGDVVSPSHLPSAPEPVDNWGGIYKEPTNVKELSQVKEPSQLKEPSQVKEPSQLKEPSKTRDLPMTQDTTTYPLRWQSPIPTQ
jgi:hypothetical protein